MSPGDGMGWMRALSERLLRERVEKLERREASAEGVRTLAAEKIQRQIPLTREEVAAYLSVSTKTIQRLDTAGELPRCAGLDVAVRYAVSDVLRLASALRREG